MMDKKKMKSDLSSAPIVSQPENVLEILNEYGTYVIQPTADSDNFYPTIAQGQFSKDKKREQKS